MGAGRVHHVSFRQMGIPLPRAAAYGENPVHETARIEWSTMLMPVTAIAAVVTGPSAEAFVQG